MVNGAPDKELRFVFEHRCTPGNHNKAIQPKKRLDLLCKLN